MDNAYNGYSQGTNNQLTPKRVDMDKTKMIYRRRKNARKKEGQIGTSPGTKGYKES